MNHDSIKYKLLTSVAGGALAIAGFSSFGSVAQADSVTVANGATGNVAAPTGESVFLAGESTVNVTIDGAESVTITGAEAGDTALSLLSVTAVEGEGDATVVFDGVGAEATVITIHDIITPLAAAEADVDEMEIALEGSNITLVVTGDVNTKGDAAVGDITFDAGSALSFAGAESQTVTAVLNGEAAGAGTINIVNGTNTVAFDAESTVGAGEDLAAINVGNESTAGNASFAANIAVETINVDAAAGSSTLSIGAVEAVVATNINVIGGAEGNVATLSLDDAESVEGAVNLDNESGSAVLSIGDEGATTLDDALTVTADGDGTINVLSDNETVTFGSTVGEAAKALGALNVGNGTAAGTAVITGDAFIAAVTIDAEGGATSLDANGDLTATTITINAGTAAADDATVSAAENLTAAVVLNDGVAGTATLDIEGAGTFTGTVTAAEANEGTLLLGAAGDVTFTGSIGSAEVAVGTVDVEDNTTTVSGSVFAQNVKIQNTAVLDIDGATLSGAIDFEGETGTLQVSGAVDQAVTGAITTLTNGDGTINVLNTTNTATFTGNIGATGESLAALNVGGAEAGQAVINGNVFVADIEGEADNGASSLDINGNVTATTLDFDAGATAGENFVTSISGNATIGTITINDANGGGSATLTLDGETAQTVTGNIVFAEGENGIVNVTNTAGVTVDGNFGTTGAGAGSVTIGAGATLTAKNGDFDVAGTITGAEGALIIGSDNGASGAAGEASADVDLTGAVTLSSLTIAGGNAFSAAEGEASTAGGAITQFDADGTVTAAVTISGGAGGSAFTNAAGAAGGAVTQADFEGAIAGNVTLVGGNAGAGSDSSGVATAGAAGGAGGLVKADFEGGITGSLTITAGNGAAGGDSSVEAGGNAGAAGAVTVDAVAAAGAVTNVVVTSGSGGAAGDGGANAGGNGSAGGAVSVAGFADTASSITLTSGSGGAGGSGAGANNGGTAGAGGAITFDMDGDVAGAITLTTGAGGAGGSAGAGAGNGSAGGAGGAISVSASADIGSIVFNDGAAGEAGAAGTGVAGAGGAAGVGTVTLNGAALQTLGSVSVGSDGSGVLVINNGLATGETAVDVEGAIGTSDLRLGTLTLTDGDVVFGGNVFVDAIGTQGDGHTVDFEGDLTVTAAAGLTVGSGGASFGGNVDAAIDLNTNDDITINGTGAQTFSKAITTLTNGEGDINITNATGTVVFNAAIGETGEAVGTITVADGADVTFSDVVATTATLNAATVRPNGNVTLGALNLAAEVGETTTIVLPSTLTNGETAYTVTGAITDGAGTTNVVMPASILGGQSVTVAAAGGASTIDGNYTVSDNALVDFTVTADDVADTITVTATTKASTATASELGIRVDEAVALFNGVSAVQGDATLLSTVSSVLQTGGTVASTAAKTLAPQSETIGAGVAVAGQVASAGTQAAGSRIAELRGLPDSAGFAAGGHETSKKKFGAWLSPFFRKSSQDDDGGRAGYDSDTKGVTLGFDAEATEGVIVGIMGSIMDTDVDGNGAGNAQTDISSHQLGVYVGVDLGKFNVDATLSYGRNSNEGSRNIILGGTTLVADSDYDSSQTSVAVMGSMPLVANEITFSPRLGLSHTRVSTDTYTETGAGALNLTVATDDSSSTLALFGLGLSKAMDQEKGTLTLTAGIDGQYGISTDDVSASSTFSGGGTSFTTNGIDAPTFTGIGSLGAVYDTGMYEVFGGYTHERSSGFSANTVRAGLKVKW